MDKESLTGEELIGLLKRRGVTLSELKGYFKEVDSKEADIVGIGEFRIDHSRGVVYVSNNKDRTILRLTGLPSPIPSLEEIPERMLDIRFESGGVNWSSLADRLPSPPVEVN
jgi:hypothetical protein